MRLLIAYGGGWSNVSGKGKYFHLKEFSNTLQKFGVECKLVNDIDYAGYLSTTIKTDFFNIYELR